MNWKAIARGIRVGLNVAMRLTTLGLIKGKAATVIDVADKVDAIVTEEVTKAKAP